MGRVEEVFDDVGVGTGLKALRTIVMGRSCSDQNNGEFFHLGPLSQGAGELKTVEAGHLDVTDDRFDLFVAKGF